ncbi:hypothetical protein DRN97_04920 [Methanosarcinales archaeon]|nr:MAG: hypothetical protein DRN97_04920 [Methanosarcinales archaeon]
MRRRYVLLMLGMFLFSGISSVIIYEHDGGLVLSADAEKSKKPDLVCNLSTKYDVEYAGSNSFINIKIANEGEKDITIPVRAKVWLGNKLLFNHSVIRSLKAGMSRVFSLPWNKKEPGDYQIKVLVDPENDIEESNESNNLLTEDVTVFTYTANTGFEDYYHYIGEGSPIMETSGAMVNSANGNLLVVYEDMSISALQFVMGVLRAYNSQRADKLGPFGYGWTFNYNEYLLVDEYGNVDYIDGDGTKIHYTKTGTGYIPPEGIYDKLAKYEDGTYKLFSLDGVVKEFSAAGKLLEITDKNGNKLTFTYNGGNLYKVTDSSGLTLTFTCNVHNLIVCVSDPTGRNVYYDYNDNNELVRATDPRGGAIEYGYDDNHRLIWIKEKENGNTTFTYLTGATPDQDKVHTVSRAVYDPSQGGNQDAFTVYSFTYSSGETQITNAKGVVTTINYNSNGNPTHISGPCAGMRFKRGDYIWSGNRITSYTDPRSYTTTYTYDAYGNKLSETDPLAHTQQWEYTVIDTVGQTEEKYISYMTKYTNRLGKEWTYTYDENGNLISITDPTNYVQTMTYNSQGLLTEESGPPHKRYEYDSHGNLIKITYDDEKYVQYTYNTIGWKLSMKDEDGYTTSYSYDNNGNLVSVSDPLGKTMSYSYDYEDRLVSVTDKLGYTTTYAYNKLLCRIEKIQNPLDYEKRYYYDNVGNLVRFVNERNVETTYSYDDLNRRISLIDAYSKSITWAYDDNDNIISVTDKLGAVVQYTYNEMNWLTQIRDQLGHITTYSYDAEGQLVRVENARGYATTYEYDAAGRLTKETDPEGNSETYTYDTFGRLKTETHKDGTSTTYTYDVRNRIEEVTDETGTTTYTYDGRGNLLTETDPLSRTTTYTYDELGRRIQVTSPMGYTTKYYYDAMDHLTKITDPNGNSISYTYDAVGRLKTETTELGKTTQYDYDPVGNIVRRTAPNGDITTYSYDYLNRRTAVNYPDGSSITYAYDAMGRVTESHNNGIGANDNLYYTYDDKGQLVKLRAVIGDFDLTIQYEYDAVGNKIKVTDPMDGVTRYQYDSMNRVISIINPYSETTTFSYDSMGRITSINYANGVVLTNTYNEKGWLTNQVYKKGTTTILSLSYSYDTIGRMTERVDSSGTTTYTYDNDDRLTSVSYPWGDTVSYSYDGAGNRLTMVVNSGTPIQYSYNEDNQLLSISDGTSFTYDSNGNVIEKDVNGQKTRYSYDYENRLTGITFPDSTVSEYKYCSCPGVSCGCGYGVWPTSVGGKRIVKSTSSGTDYYFYDGEDIILEFDSNGVLQAQYTHGPGIDNVISMRRGGESYFFLKDYLGSVVAITDEEGNIVVRYTYDAWGTIVSTTGSNIKNPYRYTGREYDSESGLYYYRARYYNSVIGRFLQRDPIGAEGGVNLYVYVNDDPINALDPTGTSVFCQIVMLKAAYQAGNDKSLMAHKCHWAAHAYVGVVMHRAGCDLLTTYLLAWELEALYPPFFKDLDWKDVFAMMIGWKYYNKGGYKYKRFWRFKIKVGYNWSPKKVALFLFPPPTGGGNRIGAKCE